MSASAAQPPKVWRVGTLQYTAGGLILLGLCLLGGDFPWALKDRAVVPSATLLIKEFGVSDFLYGLIIVSFPNFTNIILGPVISYLSDRHRGKWGRRIPYLFFTIPFIVGGLFLLGGSRVLGIWLHQAVPGISEYAGKLTVFCIAWFMLDFGSTLSGALFGALLNDVVPQQLLGRFCALLRMVSLGAGIFYNGLLIEHVRTHTAEIFFGIGIAYGLGLLLLCWMVKEGEYPPPDEEVPAGGGSGGVWKTVSRNTADYFRQSFSLGYYRRIMLALALPWLAFAPVNSFSIQYAGHIGLDMNEYGGYLVVTYLFSFALSYPLGMLADRFHPLRSGIGAMVLYFGVMSAGWICMNDTRGFGIFFILHGILSGCFMTLTASLGQRLLPRSLFAQLSSAGGLVTALLLMVFTPLLGGVLDLLHHDYHSLFLIGAVLAAVSVLVLWRVYQAYLALGGDENYRPPDPLR